MKNREKIKSIVIDALFLAVMTIFTFVPYLGYITVGPLLSFTTMHLFVLLGAILFGRKKGALYGFFFGVLSLIKAIQYPSTLDYFALDPMISVVPRVLFGLIAGLVFDFLKKFISQKTFNALSYFLCGAFTLLHSVLFLLAFYIFAVNNALGMADLLGLKEMIDSLNATYGGFMVFVGTYIGIGAIFEIIGAALVVPSLYILVYNVFGYGRVDVKVIGFSLRFNLLTVVITTFIVLIFSILLSLYI
jgi:uncharacterized membrane protein